MFSVDTLRRIDSFENEDAIIVMLENLASVARCKYDENATFLVRHFDDVYQKLQMASDPRMVAILKGIAFMIMKTYAASETCLAYLHHGGLSWLTSGLHQHGRT